MTRPTVHFTDNYLINPTNPVTVNLIGAGGTGSQVLTTLGRMNHALIALGHPGLHINLYDPDEVTTANLGRQLFAESELGLNKGVVLINRINRFFGTNWKAVPKRYDQKILFKNRGANLFITCVDTVSARVEVAAMLTRMSETPTATSGRVADLSRSRDRPIYWLDFGNSLYSGQVVLATVGSITQPQSEKYTPIDRLPFVTDEYGEELEQSGTDDTTPSCSLAEALTKQDLFINSTLAQMGSALLWSLFRQGMIESRGFFLNLKDFRTQPLKVA